MTHRPHQNAWRAIQSREHGDFEARTKEVNSAVVGRVLVSYPSTDIAIGFYPLTSQLRNKQSPSDRGKTFVPLTPPSSPATHPRLFSQYNIPDPVSAATAIVPVSAADPPPGRRRVL